MTVLCFQIKFYNIPPNSTVCNFDLTILKNGTTVHNSQTSATTTWTFLGSRLSVGEYTMVVKGADPLGRGSVYDHKEMHIFEVTSVPVVSLSTIPQMVSSYRPYELDLSAVAATSACISNPIIKFAWSVTNQTSGANISLPSSVRLNDATLTIPANTLDPGMKYQAVASAYYLAFPNSSLSIATSQISVGHSAISASFQQGNALTVNLPFTLDIDSVDPDASADPFSYSWSVVQIQSKSSWTFAADVSSAGSLYMAASTLATDKDYYINCTITKPYRSPVVISSKITVMSAQVPIVTIVRESSAKFNPAEVLGLKGNATLGAGAFQWSVSPYANLSLTTAGTNVSQPCISF